MRYSAQLRCRTTARKALRKISQPVKDELWLAVVSCDFFSCRNNEGHYLAPASLTHRWTSQKKMYRAPLEWGKKGKPRRPSQVTTQIVSSEEPPSIWVRAPSGNSADTSAYGLPQHPCAKPSKINTKLFHHRLRFTARSITGVVVLERCRHQSRATFYQGAQARKLPLIKWKPWSKCK